MKKAKPWSRKDIVEWREVLNSESEYFSSKREETHHRRWVATIDQYTRLFDEISAAGKLPNWCPHRAEPDYCDSCAYARENKLAAAWQNARKILGRTTGGQLTRHGTRAKTKSQVRKV